MNEEKLKMSTSTNGIEPGYEDAPAPGPIDPRTGMHTSYWVLNEEERAKGFVRPIRYSYIHVGPPGPKYPIRDLTEEEQCFNKDTEASEKYVKYEEYPKPNPDGSSAIGRFWTQKELDNMNKGCGVETRMNQALSETYARSPGYYGSTFCCGCRTHLPVGKNGEFVWADDNERVGT